VQNSLFSLFRIITTLNVISNLFYPPKALVAVTMVALWTFGIRMLDSSMVLCSAYIWRARSEIKKL
jgi:hypothetical protein